MNVAELIAILQMHAPSALVVDDEGLELRASDVQAVQLTRLEGKSWVGFTHGAKEWQVDDDGLTQGVQIG